MDDELYIFFLFKMHILIHSQTSSKISKSYVQNLQHHGCNAYINVKFQYFHAPRDRMAVVSVVYSDHLSYTNQSQKIDHNFHFSCGSFSLVEYVL